MAGGRRTELAREVATAAKGALSITKLGAGWPSEGSVRVGTAIAPARLYVGVIGESHRGRADERRFQNPGQDRPIEAPDGGLCMLFGVWEPTRESGDPVLVAMDAYRRAGLTTRFSMFTPVTLLEEGSTKGFATHLSDSGETLYCFRASRMSEYLAELMDLKGSGLNYDEPGFGPTSGLGGPLDAASSPDAPHAEGTIHIRPKVGMYAAFARLNYKPWFAIAEFLDNSIQSYLTNRSKLPEGPLDILIRMDEDEIAIEDRAAGIPQSEFPRAFSPSQPPPDPSGLSEFGLGMKAAACWFARYWTVRTSALGDPHERLVRFDVDRVTSHGVEHLPIETRPADAASHFTVVTLRGLRVKPRGRTIGKIKDHLASIYRVLMEKGLVRIRFSSASKEETLTFDRPPVLRAPYFRQPDGEEIEWRKSFALTLAEGRRVHGWAALLENGSASRAGFSVFRRDRLIQGSGDETYRPQRIFRNPNSFTYQRVVGELFVEGFDVSHTKDGIQWGGLEEDMLSELRKVLSAEDLPLLAQAEGYRVRQAAKGLPKGFGAEALHGAGAELRLRALSDLATPSIPDAAPVVADEEATADAEPDEAQTAPEPSEIHESYSFQMEDETGDKWTVRLELITDAAKEWFGFSTSEDAAERRLDVWINLQHPFSESYVNSDENTLGPLVRLVAALALAEIAALQSGVRRAGAVRRRTNEILRDTFGSHHEEPVL